MIPETNEENKPSLQTDQGQDLSTASVKNTNPGGATLPGIKTEGSTNVNKSNQQAKRIRIQENFRISLTGGVGADLRIGGREYAPVFNKPDASVTDAVSYLNYRFKINWIIISGIGMYYKIANRFSFYIEPLYHHYLKSIYKNSGLKKVSYIELKSGIIFNF